MYILMACCGISCFFMFYAWRFERNNRKDDQFTAPTTKIKDDIKVRYLCSLHNDKLLITYEYSRIQMILLIF